MPGPIALQTVFDGASASVHMEPFTLLGLLPLGIWGFERLVRKRPSTIMLPIIGAVALVLPNAIVNWDILRIRQLLESGKDLHITRGAVLASWHQVQRTRDWSRSGLHFRTTVSEGFFIGSDFFRWNRGDSFSAATFSNSGSPPVTFRDGQLAEVTWFVDEANQGERRIVRLRLAPR